MPSSWNDRYRAWQSAADDLLAQCEAERQPINALFTTGEITYDEYMQRAAVLRVGFEQRLAAIPTP